MKQKAKSVKLLGKNVGKKKREIVKKFIMFQLKRMLHWSRIKRNWRTWFHTLYIERKTLKVTVDTVVFYFSLRILDNWQLIQFQSKEEINTFQWVIQLHTTLFQGVDSVQKKEETQKHMFIRCKWLWVEFTKWKSLLPGILK